MKNDWTISHEGLGLDEGLPARSRLVCLEPLGRDSARTEGLISYIIRLASAHSVNPRRLIRTAFIATQPKIAVLNRFSFFRSNARTVNGLGSYAHLFCDAASTLTGRHEIRYLTLLPLQHLLPRIGEGLIGRNLKWCPDCFAEMVKSNIEPYRPLIWSFLHYQYCSIHQSPLVEHCPNCDGLQPYIPCYPSVCHCSHCRCMLSKKKRGDAASGDHLWTSAAIEDVVLNLRSLEISGAIEHLIQLAEIAANQNTSGKQRTFCKAIGLEKSALWLWTHGHQPTFLNWLKLSYALDAMPSQILQPRHLNQQPPTALRQIPNSHFPCRSQPVRTDIERQHIREELWTMANTPANHRSLSSLAKRYNCDTAVLRRMAPDLCDRIKEKYAVYRKHAGERSRTQYREKLLRVVGELIRLGEYPGGQNLKRMLSKQGMVLIPKYLKTAYLEAISQSTIAGPSGNSEQS